MPLFCETSENAFAVRLGKLVVILVRYQQKNSMTGISITTLGVSQGLRNAQWN